MEYVAVNGVCRDNRGRGGVEESLAEFSKMVHDFEKVVPGLITNHTAFVNISLL